MPSRNTRFARHMGYSDVKMMRRDDEKRPTMRNYGQRTGTTVDSSGLRARKGRKPANPPTSNNSHWTDCDWERKRQKGQL